VTVSWRKMYSEEFHELYVLPSIIRIINSIRMRWSRHVAQVRKRGMYLGY
jgi:hypothetical protein